MITSKKRREYSQKDYYKHKDKRLKTSQKYYQLHKIEKTEYQRNHRRKTMLGTKNSQWIRGLNKRDYTGYCELCEKLKGKGLAYHHWIKDNPNIGIWLCPHCHIFVHKLETVDINKYRILQQKIEKEVSS